MATGFTAKLSNTFGGVGYATTLTNESNGASVEVSENRAIAGAGWQTGLLVNDAAQSRLIFFNQSVGNHQTGQYQWGYENTGDGRWNPVVSDDVEAGGAIQATTSPCGGQPYFNFWDAKPATTIDLAGVPFADRWPQVTKTYSVRANQAQVWPELLVQDAMYFSRRAAQDHNLRAYVHGSTNNVPWTETMWPYDYLDAQHGQGDDNGQGTSNWRFPDNAVSYVDLVWDVGGQDIGIAIDAGGRNFNFQLEKGIFCTQWDNPDCGVWSFHNFKYVLSNYTRSQGQTDDFTFGYAIGTPTELALAGYPTKVNDLVP